MQVANAAFANPTLCRLLEKEGHHSTIRVKANAVLEREIEHLLTRPVGRVSYQPNVFYHTFKVAVTRRLFVAILDRIERLALPPPDINGRMLA